MGHITPMTMLAAIINQQCTTSAMPFHDERADSVAHSSGVKNSSGLTLAAAVISVTLDATCKTVNRDNYTAEAKTPGLHLQARGF